MKRAPAFLKNCGATGQFSMFLSRTNTNVCTETRIDFCEPRDINTRNWKSSMVAKEGVLCFSARKSNIGELESLPGNHSIFRRLVGKTGIWGITLIPRSFEMFLPNASRSTVRIVPFGWENIRCSFQARLYQSYKRLCKHRTSLRVSFRSYFLRRMTGRASTTLACCKKAWQPILWASLPINNYGAYKE